MSCRTRPPYPWTIAVVVCLLGTTSAADDFSQWHYRAKITVPGYTRSSTLTNFPLLIMLDTNRFRFSYAQMADSTNGGDLRFSDATSTNALMYEIEAGNQDAVAYIWVRLPELSTNGSPFFMYWGNTNTTHPACTTNGSAWDTTFHAVWHLDQTNAVGDLRDATSNSYNGVNQGTVNATGLIAFGQSGAYIEIPTGQQRPLPCTLSAWIKTTGDQIWVFNYGYDNNFNIFGVDGWLVGGPAVSWEGHSQADQKVLLSTEHVNDNEWHHIAYVRSAGSDGVTTMGTIYVDGLTDGNYFHPHVGGSHSFFHLLENMPAAGVADEMRIANVMRSGDWVHTEWLNVVSNSSFFGCTPWVYNLMPSNIVANQAELAGHVTWTTAVPWAVTVHWGTNDMGETAVGWDASEVLGAVGPGHVSTTVAVEAGIRYYYRYHISNEFAESWATSAATFINSAIHIDATDPSASEDGPDNGEFLVSRALSATGMAVTVYYTMAGSAGNGQDYDFLGGSVDIAAGSTGTVVTLATIDDLLLNERPESAIMQLAPGPYSRAASTSAAITITENDFARMWMNSMPVTFSGYDRTSVLTNFPVLIVLNEGIPGFAYRDSKSPHGYDLAFMSPDESTLLSHEIERWDTNGDSYVWVQIPLLEDSNTFARMVWGTDMTTPPAYSTNGRTWSEGFAGVWHLDETNAADNFAESGTERNTGIRNGDPVSITGMVCGGIHFDNDDNMQSTNAVGISGSEVRTVGMWVNPTGEDDTGHLFSLGNTSLSSGSIWCPAIFGSLLAYWGHSGGLWFVTDDPLPANEWNYFILTHNGSDLTFFLNGVQVHQIAGGAYWADTVDTYTVIGPNGWQGETAFWADEYRVSRRLRSDDWIYTEWSNMYNPTGFYSFGQVEHWGGTVFIVR